MNSETVFVIIRFWKSVSNLLKMKNYVMKLLKLIQMSRAV